jgi:cell division protein FtsB
MSRLSRPALWIGTFALIMIGLALVTTVIPFRQIVEQQNRLEAARTELARVEAENQMLDSEVTALDTPAEIERLARENLGYVMPGETAYVILEPAETTVSSEPITATEPQRVPWYRAIWNFFTGADLAGTNH